MILKPSRVLAQFTAYAFYKDLERILYKEKIPLSVKKAGEQTQNMYQLTTILPQSRRQTKILLKMSELQSLLIKIISKYYRGIPKIKTGSRKSFV